jgi:hypothetical protein
MTEVLASIALESVGAVIPSERVRIGPTGQQVTAVSPSENVSILLSQ